MSIAEANPNDNQLHSEHSRCILFDSCEDRLSGYLLPNLLVNHRRRQALLEQGIIQLHTTLAKISYC